MKILAVLLFFTLAVAAKAAPYACKVCATNGLLVVRWCGITPGASVSIEWSTDAITFLKSTAKVRRLGLGPDEAEAALQMTEKQLFVRLTEE